MTSDNHSDGVELPEGWPEAFTSPEFYCNHQFLWERSAGCYRCMYCEISKDEPPKQLVATEDGTGGSNE